MVSRATTAAILLLSYICWIWFLDMSYIYVTSVVYCSRSSTRSLSGSSPEPKGNFLELVLMINVRVLLLIMLARELERRRGEIYNTVYFCNNLNGSTTKLLRVPIYIISVDASWREKSWNFPALRMQGANRNGEEKRWGCYVTADRSYSYD